MAKRISVVLSQGQSQNPAKRQLEEDIIGGLIMEPGIDVIVIPHLYDLRADGTGMLALQGASGNLIVLGWLFERAMRWTLDRFGIHGHVGTSLIKSADEDEDDELDDEENADDEAAADDKERVITSRKLPNRRIYCVDLRASNSAQTYIDEVKRIAKENSFELLGLDLFGSTSLSSRLTNASTQPSPGVTAEQAQRFAQPTNDTFVGAPATGDLALAPSQITRIEETGDRRWYPVIDYSRCTNCMECIDFCLFGVYGVDRAETILVEQPDNCRKGCPACSRVCPENAIIFPQHKTPAIAGAAITIGGLKIDLSRLFGAPDTGESAEQAAVRERDEQLVAAGRAAVGNSTPLAKRHVTSAEPKDELDSLLDELDASDV